MRAGIFGGSFNPPHSGHKKLALEITGRLSLDFMLIVPTFIPPHKSADMLASSPDRLRMCELCFNEDFFKVSDMEIKREGKSYTVETLRSLREIYPDDELFFVMGSDMLLSFHSWYCPDEILSLSNIVCAARHGGETQELKNYIEEYFPDKTEKFTVIDFEPVDVSSTQIRNEIASSSFSENLSEDVLDYIKKRGLYV